MVVSGFDDAEKPKPPAVQVALFRTRGQQQREAERDRASGFGATILGKQLHLARVVIGHRKYQSMQSILTRIQYTIDSFTVIKSY